MKQRWLILCNDCGNEVDEDSVIGIFEAKFGPVDEEVDMSLLICQPWSAPRANNEPVQQFFCDECGMAVAVAESSQWFIEQHRKEMESQIDRA